MPCPGLPGREQPGSSPAGRDWRHEPSRPGNTAGCLWREVRAAKRPQLSGGVCVDVCICIYVSAGCTCPHVHFCMSVHTLYIGVCSCTLHVCICVCAFVRGCVCGRACVKGRWSLGSPEPGPDPSAPSRVRTACTVLLWGILMCPFPLEQQKGNRDGQGVRGPLGKYLLMGHLSRTIVPKPECHPKEEGTQPTVLSLEGPGSRWPACSVPIETRVNSVSMELTILILKTLGDPGLTGAQGGALDPACLPTPTP